MRQQVATELQQKIKHVETIENPASMRASGVSTPENDRN
jgi:hypothetical protein